MVAAAMAECGCGMHDYHDNPDIPLSKNGWYRPAHVRCANHSLTGKKEAYPLTAAGGKAWEDNYRSEALA